MKKNQKSKEHYQRESCITGRVMLVFLAAALGLWGFSTLVTRLDYVSSFRQAWTAVQVLMGLFAVGAAACGFLWWKNRGNKALELKVITPDLVGVICLVGAFGCWMIRSNFTTAMSLLNLLLPVLALLYMFYYTYQREFFFLSVAAALSAFAMYNAGASAGGLKRLALGLAAVALCAALAWANYKSEKGLFMGLRVREEQGCPKLPLIAYPVLALLVAAALVLGAPVAFYLMYAGCALIFAAAVYFTVKLL